MVVEVGEEEEMVGEWMMDDAWRPGGREEVWNSFCDVDGSMQCGQGHASRRKCGEKLCVRASMVRVM